MSKKLITMNNNFFLSPDPVNSGSAAQPADVSDTHTRHLTNVPAKDSALSGVGSNANMEWKSNPDFKLVWVTQAAFEKDVIDFTDILEQRRVAGSNLSPTTNELENLDNQIDDAIPFVKSYINNKYGPKDGPSHFAEFGLVHTHHHFDFPTDRQGRKGSIKMMADAIAKEGFDKNTYGSVFWNEMLTKYDDFLKKSSDTSGDVSEHVSELVQLRTKIRKVLHSLLLLIEANYPDTMDQVRRKWGFQKEKY